MLTNTKPISIGFEVKDGPSATITFKNGRCRMEQGVSKCDVKLPFSSCEKFNGLIDGTVTPIPSKGFQHIKFLLKTFTPLTDLLAKYMRPSPEDLEDRTFFVYTNFETGIDFERDVAHEDTETNRNEEQGLEIVFDGKPNEEQTDSEHNEVFPSDVGKTRKAPEIG